MYSFFAQVYLSNVMSKLRKAPPPPPLSFRNYSRAFQRNKETNIALIVSGTCSQLDSSCFYIVVEWLIFPLFF